MYSRRHFLKTSAAARHVACVHRHPGWRSVRLPHTWARSSALRRMGVSPGVAGRTLEAWHSEAVATWQSVAMPHCFNAYDACDPEVPYYRGNGWYRTHVPIANPYAGGRTLLQFEGAGQTTAVYVGEKLAGKHTGGYDEFVFDITDLLQTQTTTEATPAKGKPKKTDGVPIAVLCDNSRDLDRMPSDLSDFSLYGGMYRHVNLVYVPTVSLATVHVQTKLPSPRGPAEIAVVGTIRTSLPPVSAG